MDSVPEKFIIYISADNRYRLYINGEYRLSGPSSGDIDNYRYETLNIANQLHEGDNILAVEVVISENIEKHQLRHFKRHLYCKERPVIR